jgi:uncharacterized protein
MDRVRRKDREITERATIDEILNKEMVCRVAMCDGNEPYVVPLSFAHVGKSLYFHSAHAGRKLDVIKKNNRVCFEVDGDVTLRRGDEACSWGMKYRSVIGMGRAVIVDGREEKAQALNAIMQKYAGRQFTFSDQAVGSITVWRIDIDSMTGKQCQ